MSASSGDPITIALTFVRTSAGPPTTVVVSATSETTWAEVAPLLPSRLGETAWFVGQQSVGADMLVGAGPLLHATQLTDRPHSSSPRPLLQLALVEGPDCGLTRPVGSQVVIGRAPESDVCVRDLSLSRAHARIDVAQGHAAVRDLGSTNGTWVDEQRVGPAATELRVGQRLRTGSTVSRLTGVTTTAPLPVHGGRRTLSRAPRQVSEPATVELTRPQPPQIPEQRLPWLMLLIPVPVAVLLALLLRSPMFLAFAIFGPLMMVGQYLHDRIGGRRSRREEMAEFTTRTAKLERKIENLLHRERTDRRRLAPDLAEVASQVRSGRCWARRPGDADHLRCRLGTGRVTSGVTVRTNDGERETFGLERTPVTLDLGSHRLTGIACGDPDTLDRAVDSVLGQLVATHSPALLHVIVVSRRAADADRWGWAAWLPHLRPDTTEAPLILDPAHDDEHLRGLVGTWAVEPDHTSPTLVEAPAVHTVVLLDGAGLSHRPLLHALALHAAAHGVSVVAAAPTTEGVPADCTATVRLDGPGSGLLLTERDTQPFTPDLPAQGWREYLATRLSGTVDTTPGAQGGEPPTQVRLLDVLGDVSPGRIADGWRRRPRETDVLLGLGPDGPVTVDLVRDGPHALVGGTTGSGKSELLQTLIASLALANRPDELVFLLVDYKGGAAFKDCVDLPHTVGLVTDLDPFLTRRALASLDAEIRRRERLLASTGAKDLEDYQDRATTSDPVIPRLVLVVDEFRVLAEELPEFLEGVVRLAAVGRSLGIHVVLATQRPAGIVSADIRANVNLRIALRVRDAADSDDIIESPAAARISSHTPGRALLRTGATPPVPVQSARVSGSARTAAPVRVLSVDPHTARVVGAPVEEPLRETTSDLRLLVDAIRAAADHEVLPPVRSPWLPPPPAVLPRPTGSPARLLGGSPIASDVPLAPLGLLDLPAEQRQVLAGWALGSGHLAVIGGPRSGRTTTLRTVAAGLARQWAPDDVHLYVLETAGGLGALASLPHTGAVIDAADSTQVRRMLDWLAEECTRRQQQLARHDHADLTEQRRDCGAEGPLPHLVLLLDGWDTVQSEYELADGAVLDTLLRLLRDGPAVGLSLVLAGGRAVLSGRVASAVQHRLCLRMADEMDLVLAGLRPAQVPHDMPPGRALVLPDGHELQVALPGESADGTAQSAAVRAVAATAPRPTRRPPKPFRSLPDLVHLTGLRTAGPDPGGALIVGVGGEDAHPVTWSPDPVRGAAALVCGPPGSGRTTALRTLAAQLADRGPVLWHACAGTPSELPEQFHVARGGGVDADRTLLENGFATLVLDDAELLDDLSEELALVHLARCGDGLGALLVAGTTADLIGSYRGVAHELGRRQSGLLLQPARGDGDLLGAQVPHTGRHVPGRGVLVQRSRGIEVQVAQPPPEGNVHDLLTDGRHTAGDVR